MNAPSSSWSWIFLATLCTLGCSGSAELDGATRSAEGGSAAGSLPVPLGGNSTSGGIGGGQGGDSASVAGQAGNAPEGGGGATSSSGGSGGAGGTIAVPTTPFVHPGVLVNRAMLDFVKGKLASKAAPWQAALDAASKSRYGSLSYQAKPRADVQCGPTSDPDVGCTDEKNDVVAAYTHALLWYYTGQKSYADKAIEIMNAWSAVLQKHTLDNAQLQAAWCAEVFPRAAEIIRYSNAGWPDADIAQFERMLREVYLPIVKDGAARNGNWDTSAIDAGLNIAVFLDDHAQFEQSIELWQARTPAYIYLKSDGDLPVQPPRVAARSEAELKTYWYDPKTFVDGLSQESCRDRSGSGTAGFGHAQYGVAAIINAAETARIQGVDLFSLEQQRLTAFLELHAKYLNGASTSSLCDAQIAGVNADPMWEIGYNAYAGVLGASLPETLKVVKANRPADVDHHMAWETLTHADIGSAGL